MVHDKSYWLSQTWGKLKLNSEQKLPDEWGQSSKKLHFVCSCGRYSYSNFQSVDIGSASSCGRCNDKPKEYWLAQTWGKLKLDPSQDLPEEWGKGSGRKFRFICECGRPCCRPLGKMSISNTASCGHCNDKPKEHWLSQTWGKLKLDPNQDLPNEWPSQSNLKFEFLCGCGRTKPFKFYVVTSGINESCGRNCNSKPKSYWLQQRWGRLALVDFPTLPQEWGRGSADIFQVMCSCGRALNINFYNLTNGSTISCHKCKFQPKSYWLQQTWGKLRLDPDQDLPDEWGKADDSLFEFICSCGNKCIKNWEHVSYGDTASCGCLNRGLSEYSEGGQVFRYVNQRAPDAKLGFWVVENKSRFEYDIYIPSLKLAIEYHGLIWHSEKYNLKKRDRSKFQLAKKRNDRLIQIYSDEWRNKQEIMKEMLRSLILPKGGKRIKPKFSIHYKTPSEARDFLDAHHYLGAASQTKGKGLTVIAMHGSAVVGVWVFMKREANVILWHRAAWNHAYRAWNPHEKALALALPLLKEMGFKRMVTFSDNRFHTGEMYEKLGFTFEEELKPDYGYTNGYRRISKYALRVKAGINEVEAARGKGWYRIWDSGKRRYSFSF